jgi:hypothetical protein
MQEHDNNKTHVPQVVTAVNTPRAEKQAQCNWISQSTVKDSWHKRRIRPAGTDDDAVAQKRFCHLLRHSRGWELVNSINIPANHKVFITQWTPRFGLVDRFPVTKRPPNHTGFQARSHSCEKLLLVSTLMLWSNKCTLLKYDLTCIIRTRFRLIIYIKVYFISVHLLVYYVIVNIPLTQGCTYSAHIGFVMSVCLSACISAAPTGRVSLKFNMGGEPLGGKNCRRNQQLVKIGKNSRHWRPK